MTWPWKKKAEPPTLVEAYLFFPMPLTQPGTGWDGYTYWYRFEVT